MTPFLTIITRCCQRPVMLQRNVESVLAQLDRDLEQVFVVDNERRGVPWANGNLATAARRVAGEYAYILDDDTALVERFFVARLKEFVQWHGSPDVVMVRSLRLQLAPTVLPTVWGDPALLRMGATNCLCYVVKSDQWRGNIAKFGLPAAGDWHFLAALREAGCSFGWLDLVVAKTQQLGRGIHFEECPPDWFAQVARKFRVADLGRGDWRLQLYLQRPPAKPERKSRARPASAPQPKPAPTLAGPQAAAPQPAPRRKSPHVLLGRRK